MQKPNIYIAIITLIFSLLSTNIVAQDTLKTKKRKEFQIGFGPASYSGDLGKAYSNSSLLFTIGLKLNKDKRLNGNVKFSIGSVSGQELDYEVIDKATGNPATPNTYFKSNFIAINYEVQYNIINKENIKLYVSQGIGVFWFNPKDQFSNKLLDQLETRPLGENYGNLTIQLPTQLGVKYYLENNFAVGIQAGFLNTMTDNLDNLSTWGNKNGLDNILSLQFQIHLPIPLSK